MITYFNDTFSGTVGTNLDAHTSDSGHTWTQLYGANLTLTGSNGLTGPGDMLGQYYTDCIVTASEFAVELEFDWTGPPGSPNFRDYDAFVGPSFSGETSPGTWRDAQAEFWLYDWNIYHAHGGASLEFYNWVNQTGDYPRPFADSLSDGTHTLRFHLKDGVFQAISLDGVDSISVSDNWALTYWVSPYYWGGVNLGVRIGLWMTQAWTASAIIRRLTVTDVGPPDPFWQDYRLATETVA